MFFHRFPGSLPVVVFRFVRALPVLGCAIVAAPAAAQPLPLQEALDLAVIDQPLLAGQRASIEAGRQASVAAAQLPDPTLKAGILNMPIEGAEAFTLGRDSMTMRTVSVMQAFPREEKRRLRGDMLRLDSEQRALEFDFTTRMIRRDAALAWLDVWYAERGVELVHALQAQTRTLVDSLAIGLRTGRASAADAAAGQVELELLGDREAEYSRRAAVARVDLGRWIGGASSRPLPAAAPVLRPPVPVTQLLAELERHPHLDAMAVQTRIAETDARLAQAASKPDWNLEVGYANRGSAYSDMVSIQVGIDLPLFQHDRQDRQVLAKVAEASRSRALRDDNLRQMRADLARIDAERESAEARAAAFRDRILPSAQARVDAAAAAYRAGTGTLSAVLDARRTMLVLGLERLEREGQAARALLQLEYFTTAGVDQ
jgi:outer membrane protein TolC